MTRETDGENKREKFLRDTETAGARMLRETHTDVIMDTERLRILPRSVEGDRGATGWMGNIIIIPGY